MAGDRNISSAKWLENTNTDLVPWTTILSPSEKIYYYLRFNVLNYVFINFLFYTQFCCSMVKNIVQNSIESVSHVLIIYQAREVSIFKHKDGLRHAKAHFLLLLWNILFHYSESNCTRYVQSWSSTAEIIPYTSETQDRPFYLRNITNTFNIFIHLLLVPKRNTNSYFIKRCSLVRGRFWNTIRKRFILICFWTAQRSIF